MISGSLIPPPILLDQFHMSKLITSALELAQKAHLGQFRNFLPIPYIFHPLEVYKLALECEINDENILAAILLHDTIEDSQYNYVDIEKQTNSIVADLVQKLTKNPDQFKYHYLENIIQEKIPNVMIIKTLDRLCNTRDFIKHDLKYAKKYLMKAFPLLEIMVNENLNPKVSEKINDILDDLHMKLTDSCSSAKYYRPENFPSCGCQSCRKQYANRTS